MALQALIVRNVLIVRQSIPRYVVKSSLKNSVKCFCNSPVKNFYQDYFKVTPKGSDKLKLSDGVPATYSLIYRSPLGNYLKFGYPFMLFVTLSGPIIAFYLHYVKGSPMKNTQNTEIKSHMNVNINFFNAQFEVCIYLGAMCLFTAAVFSVMFKTPFRIYKHKMERKYIAIFLNTIPAKVQHFHFKTAAQTTFKNPAYFFCEDAQYLIDNKKAILFEYYFRTGADMCDMLGVN